MIVIDFSLNCNMVCCNGPVMLSVCVGQLQKTTRSYHYVFFLADLLLLCQFCDGGRGLAEDKWLINVEVLFKLITINYAGVMHKLPAAPVAVFCFVALYCIDCRQPRNQFFFSLPTGGGQMQYFVFLALPPYFSVFHFLQT